MKTKLRILALCILSICCYAASFYVAGCKNFDGIKPETVEVAVQIATMEVAAKLKPAERAELKRIAGQVSDSLREVAASGVVSLDSVVHAIEKSGALAGNADVLRWSRELALIVGAQWRGVQVNSAKVKAFADKLDAITAAL